MRKAWRGSGPERFYVSLERQPIQRGKETTIFISSDIYLMVEGMLIYALTSGVTSATENPVPPVVIMRLTALGPSAQSMMFLCMSKTLSDTMRSSTTSHRPPPSCISTSRRTVAEASADGSLAAVVETMRIAALNGPSMMSDEAGDVMEITVVQRRRERVLCAVSNRN